MASPSPTEAYSVIVVVLDHCSPPVNETVKGGWFACR